MNSLSHLKLIGNQHMMSHFWDGRQRHVTTYLFRKFLNSRVLIVVCQCGKWQKIAKFCDLLPKSLKAGISEAAVFTRQCGSIYPITHWSEAFPLQRNCWRRCLLFRPPKPYTQESTQRIRKTQKFPDREFQIIERYRESREH
jgi:hypothetical protein